MLKFFKKMKKNRKGYTLTELIVVVAILGVLAAIGVPAVMSTIESSKKQADETTAKSIETAYQVLMAEGVVTVSVTTVDGVKTYTPTPTGTTLGTKIGEKLQGGLKAPQQSSTGKWCLDPSDGTVTARASAGTGEVELN